MSTADASVPATWAMTDLCRHIVRRLVGEAEGNNRAGLRALTCGAGVASCGGVISTERLPMPGFQKDAETWS